MTATAPQSIAAPSLPGNAGTRRSYAHAHWYFLAAFLVVLAGFWPSFYGPLGAGTSRRNFHGITASLWYFALMLQSWLVANGHVQWHRRVARGIALLLPVLLFSMISNVSTMLAAAPNPLAPPPPLIALLSFQSVLQLVVLFALGIRNRHTPAAHKRYMAATALVGLGPALGRLFHNLGVDNLGLAFLGPLIVPSTVELILLVLIVVDRRNGERQWAYPMLLIWTIAVELLLGPLSFTSGWLAFCHWFAALGVAQ